MENKNTTTFALKKEGMPSGLAELQVYCNGVFFYKHVVSSKSESAIEHLKNTHMERDFEAKFDDTIGEWIVATKGKLIRGIDAIMASASVPASPALSFSN